MEQFIYTQDKMIVPKRRDGIEEEVDPRELSWGGFLGIVGREPVWDCASPIVGLDRRR